MRFVQISRKTLALAAAVALCLAAEGKISARDSGSTPRGEEPGFAAKMALVAPCRRDEPCRAAVVLEALGAYHINDKYPYKFKAREPTPGIRYSKSLVGREEGSFEEKRATFPLAFVSETGGDKTLAGVLSFSVCSPQHCVVDKRELELTVHVE